MPGPCDCFQVRLENLVSPKRDREAHRAGIQQASGYAPLYSEQSIDAGQMAVVTRAIDRMLQPHEPHPALVLGRHWDVIRTNEAAPRFFGSFVDWEARPKPLNLLDLNQGRWRSCFVWMAAPRQAAGIMTNAPVIHTQRGAGCAS